MKFENEDKPMPLEDALAFVRNAVEKNHGLVLLSAHHDGIGIRIDARLREIPGHHLLLLASDLWNHTIGDNPPTDLKLVGDALDRLARQIAEVKPGIKPETLDLSSIRLN